MPVKRSDLNKKRETMINDKVRMYLLPPCSMPRSGQVPPS